VYNKIGKQKVLDKYKENKQGIGLGPQSKQGTLLNQREKHDANKTRRRRRRRRERARKSVYKRILQSVK
jgi:hypothetical protein